MKIILLLIIHATYGESEALFGIKKMKIIKGSLPPKGTGLVIESALQHKDELLENWHLALNHQRLLKIEPLY